jgi:hypothetical protein
MGFSIIPLLLAQVIKQHHGSHEGKADQLRVKFFHGILFCG